MSPFTSLVFFSCYSIDYKITYLKLCGFFTKMVISVAKGYHHTGSRVLLLWQWGRIDSFSSVSGPGCSQPGAAGYAQEQVPQCLTRCHIQDHRVLAATHLGGEWAQGSCMGGCWVAGSSPGLPKSASGSSPLQPASLLALAKRINHSGCS